MLPTTARLCEQIPTSFSSILTARQICEHLATVFATGQSVRPELRRGRTAVCRPVRSFSKVARQVGIKDGDGRYSVVPSRLFLNLPDKKNLATRTDEIVSSPSSPAVPHRPPPSPAVPRRLPPSSAVFRYFPLFSAIACRPPPSSTTPGCPLPSPTRICLRSWGLSSFLMTAVLDIQGRGRKTFCRPVQSFSQVTRQVGMKDEDGLRFAVPSRPGLLAAPPPGPTGAPDDCEHCLASASRTPYKPLSIRHPPHLQHQSPI